MECFPDKQARVCTERRGWDRLPLPKGSEAQRRVASWSGKSMEDKRWWCIALLSSFWTVVCCGLFEDYR